MKIFITIATDKIHLKKKKILLLKSILFIVNVGSCYIYSLIGVCKCPVNFDLVESLPFVISVYCEDTPCVGLARVGCKDQKIVSGSMKQLLNVDFGPPLHCLVIVGNTHPLEDEMLEFYMVEKS